MCLRHGRLVDTPSVGLGRVLGASWGRPGDSSSGVGAISEARFGALVGALEQFFSGFGYPSASGCICTCVRMTSSAVFLSVQKHLLEADKI